MPMACPSCKKTVSGDKATCYYCGAFLAPRLECPKCQRAIPQTRATCHFCGTSLANAKLADVAPADNTPPPNLSATPPTRGPSPGTATTPKEPPVAMLMRPDIVLEKRSAFGAWCAQHQVELDLALFVLGFPIAACAIASQAIIGAVLRMMSAGRS